MDKDILIILLVGIAGIIILIALVTGKLKRVKTQWFEINADDSKADKTNKDSKVQNNNACNTDDSVQEIKTINLDFVYEEVYAIFRHLMIKNHILVMSDEKYIKYTTSNINKIINVLRPYYETITEQQLDNENKFIRDYFREVFIEIRRMSREYEEAHEMNMDSVLVQIMNMHQSKASANLASQHFNKIRSYSIEVFDLQIEYLKHKVRSFIFISFYKYLKQLTPNCQIKIVHDK